ncbi:MAG: YIP1 family protein [Acidobacteriota bacterium]|nr:YIP1 family protein [Acidobacteriota bacterium]
MNEEQGFPPPPQPPRPPQPPMPPQPPGPPGEPPAPRALEPLPWENRDQLGFAGGLVETIKLLIMNPAEAFQRARRTGDYASPLFFGILVWWFSTMVAMLWQFLFNSASMAPMLQGMEDAGVAIAGTGVALILIAILAPAFALISLFIWAGILHLCLMIVGGLESSETGFEGTLRVVCYGSVAQLASIVPILGGFITFAWQIVLFVIGFIHVHRTTQGKSILATLLPLILCCVCIIVVVMIAVGAGVGASSGFFESLQ